MTPAESMRHLAGIERAALRRAWRVGDLRTTGPGHWCAGLTGKAPRLGGTWSAYRNGGRPFRRGR